MAVVKKNASRKVRVSKVNKDEPRSDKFRRLARQRVSACLNKMIQIGNLSGSNYEYTEDDVNKIAEALSDQLKTTLMRFQPKKPGERRNKAQFEI